MSAWGQKLALAERGKRCYVKAEFESPCELQHLGGLASRDREPGQRHGCDASATPSTSAAVSGSAIRIGPGAIHSL